MAPTRPGWNTLPLGVRILSLSRSLSLSPSLLETGHSTLSRRTLFFRMCGVVDGVPLLMRGQCWTGVAPRSGARVSCHSCPYAFLSPSHHHSHKNTDLNQAKALVEYLITIHVIIAYWKEINNRMQRLLKPNTKMLAEPRLIPPILFKYNPQRSVSFFLFHPYGRVHVGETCQKWAFQSDGSVVSSSPALKNVFVTKELHRASPFTLWKKI